MHLCARVCICLVTRACGCTLEQARSLKISDRFPCVFLFLCLVCVCKCRGWLVCPLSWCVCFVVCLCAVVPPYALLPMPCAISRQHFIRPECPDHVPRPTGSANSSRIGRFRQQHPGPAPQTLTLQ